MSRKIGLYLMKDFKIKYRNPFEPTCTLHSFSKPCKENQSKYIKGNRKCLICLIGIAVGKQKLDRTFNFDKRYIIDFTHFCSFFGICISMKF